MTDLAAPVLNDPRNGIIHLTRRLRSLADMRGFWSLGDQAVLSLGNFLTNWLLLRSQAVWYGNYFIVLSFILFMNNLHMALVTYPLSVTSSGISDSELRRRIRRAIGMTLLLAIPEGAAICWGTVATVGWYLVPLVIGALVLWQLQETVRRALMARLEHRRAIFGDIISYLGQAAAIWFVIHHGTISIENVFQIICITCLIAFVIQAIQVRVFAPIDTLPMHSLRHHLYHNWNLGKWVLSSNITNVITCYSIPWTIRYFHGAMGVAMFSAVVLLPNASNPLLAGVANLITPVVAKIKAEGTLREAKHAAMKYALQGGFILLMFFGFLSIAPSVALHIFYKTGSPYLQLVTPLRVFVVVYALMYISAALTSYLCGLGESKLPFYGQVANAVITCLITLPLCAKYGVTGAAWGGLFPVAFQVILGIFFVQHHNIPADKPSGGVALATP